MCYVNIIRETDLLTLFEVYFEDDKIPYRVWADTQEHAKKQAQGIANYLQWVEDPLKLHQLPK